MKRNIIKSVPSVGNHAWLFKHLLEENPVLKGVLKGNTKNLSLNQNLEVINCALRQIVVTRVLRPETKDGIWLKSFFRFFGDSDYDDLVDKAQKQTFFQHLFLLFSFVEYQTQPGILRVCWIAQSRVHVFSL